MIRYVISVSRMLLYWLLLFVVGRIVFLLFNHDQLADIGFTNTMKVFVYGLRLDLSMASYLTVIPLLLMVVSDYVKAHRSVRIAQNVYVILITGVILFITLADAELYKHWGQKLNTYAASFAKFPKEMLVFSTGGALMPIILAVVIMAGSAIVSFKTIWPRLVETTQRWWLPPVMVIVLLPFLFLGIRGGWGKSTINQSSAFYSPHLLLNHAAVNTSWNLMASVVDAPEETSSNPYSFVDEADAKNLLAPFMFNPAGHNNILNEAQPNIVVIVLEGWTGDVIGSIGGEADVTPELNALSKQGLLFTNFFANGNRTDKGLASIISSQPSLAHSSIINNIQKFTSLPSLPAELVKDGYHTSFYYGGASEFANMKGYWLSAGYQQIVDLNDFPVAKRNAEWGVHDDVLWEETLVRLGKMQSPFFVTVLTLSSHEPFNVPHQSQFNGTDEADMYRNSVHFSDKQLGAFFAQASKQPWYQHTLFVIMSDHGHQWPKNRLAYDPERFHIPLLFVGGALNPSYQGKHDSTIACQVDIAATLLSQLSLPTNTFTWSRNFLDSAYVPFATYVYNDGIGMVTPVARVVYDQESKQRIITQGIPSTCDTLEKQARAYEQLYFEEYRKR